MNEKLLTELEGWLFQVVVDLATDQSDGHSAADYGGSRRKRNHVAASRGADEAQGRCDKG